RLFTGCRIDSFTDVPCRRWHRRISAFSPCLCEHCVDDGGQVLACATLEESSRRPATCHRGEGAFVAVQDQEWDAPLERTMHDHGWQIGRAGGADHDSECRTFDCRERAVKSKALFVVAFVEP